MDGKTTAAGRVLGAGTGSADNEGNDGRAKVVGMEDNVGGVGAGAGSAGAAVAGVCGTTVGSDASADVFDDDDDDDSGDDGGGKANRGIDVDVA